MAKKTTEKPQAPLDQLFVLGLDENGKPRGARFKEAADRTVSIALDMRLNCIYPASPAFAEMGMKLPQGRIYASGKAFVPNIRRDLYDKLKAHLMQPDNGCSIMNIPNPSSPLASSSEDAVTPDHVPCVSPIVGGLPRNWESVGVGHMVLIQESPEDGWWEATVASREDDVLTLRLRDYPKAGTYVRHLSAVALVNPGPA